jgi:hypothetical protein
MSQPGPLAVSTSNLLAVLLSLSKHRTASRFQVSNRSKSRYRAKNSIREYGNEISTTTAIMPEKIQDL